MFNFLRETILRRTRKEHQCVGCSTPIRQYHSATKYVAVDGGELISCYYHVECREAETALNRLYGDNYYPEDWVNLSEADEPDWLRREHPIVAERLGLLTEADAICIMLKDK